MGKASKYKVFQTCHLDLRGKNRFVLPMVLNQRSVYSSAIKTRRGCWRISEQKGPGRLLSYFLIKFSSSGRFFSRVLMTSGLFIPFRQQEWSVVMCEKIKAHSVISPRWYPRLAARSRVPDKAAPTGFLGEGLSGLICQQICSLKTGGNATALNAASSFHIIIILPSIDVVLLTYCVWFPAFSCGNTVAKCPPMKMNWERGKQNI